MSASSSRRRSVRQAGHRRRSIYAEPETDDDLTFSDDSYSEPAITPPPDNVRTSRRSRAPRAVEATSPATAPRPQPVRRARKLTVGEQVLQRVTARINAPKKRKAHNELGSRRQRRGPAHDAKPVVNIPTDGIIPPWSTLPYEILLQVFTYARDADKASGSWLISSACRTCRAFAEPALSAYYQAPRLSSPHDIQSLCRLVMDPGKTLFVNYAVKIKRLEVGNDILARDHINDLDLPKLVSCLPQLEDIITTSPQDKPPYRRHSHPRWRLTDTWLQQMMVLGVHLRSWRWNWEFVRQNINHWRLYDYMIMSHSSQTFSTLRHLEIGDHPAVFILDDDSGPQENKVAEAICLLPALTSLELETCDIVNAGFLKRLPRTLRWLRLANCEALTSDAMEEYLTQDGGCQLEGLTLDHNAHLDLNFLTMLKRTCPKLRQLFMDMRCFSQQHSVSDVEPRYKFALNESIIPTWPLSIDTIRIQHVQKLTAGAGETVFTSLLDAAAELPNLRCLQIEAHISIAWRDRISFKEKWTEELRRTFLRRCRNPDPSLASLKAFRMAREVKNGGAVSQPVSGTRRRLSSVSIHPVSNLSDFEQHDAPGMPKSGRRSTRIAASKEEQAAQAARRSQRMEMLSAPSPSDTGSSAGEGSGHYVQGLCHTVDITVDNLRPREVLLNEGDFLDSEQSGDEDWTEHGEAQEESYAW